MFKDSEDKKWNLSYLANDRAIREFDGLNKETKNFRPV
jgi:hypothetical protein